MKATKLFCFLLTAVFLFTACSSSQQQENSNHEKFIYRMADGTSLDWNTSIGVPVKVNLVSGKTTSVCIDPLCMHDSAECPFFECYGCAADGWILFFRRGWTMRTENGTEGSEKLCTYNAATGEVHVLHDSSDAIVYAGIHKNTLYYYLAQFSFDEDTPYCIYRLYRADGVSGTVTELPLDKAYKTVGGYTSNSDYPNILSIEDDRIYWKAYTEDGGEVCYMTDLDGQNRQELSAGSAHGVVFHNGWSYSIKGVSELIDPDAGRTPENLINTYTLYRTSLTDSTEEIVSEGLNTPNFLVTDRYIFTMDSFSSETKGSTQILHGCRIYQMNHDGSARTVIAENEDDSFIGQQFGHNAVMFGCYEDAETTYLAFFFAEINADGETVLSGNTLILNTATGEFTVSDSVG